MGKACIGEDSARSAEKKCSLGRHTKLWASEGFSDKAGLGKKKRLRAKRGEQICFLLSSLLENSQIFGWSKESVVLVLSVSMQHR